MATSASAGNANRTGWVRLLSTLLFGNLALALVFPYTAIANTDKTVWSSREQFVTIIPQDDTSSATSPNEHPVDLTPDQVRNALSAMVLAPNSNQKQLPVFNEPEIDMLSQYIPEALHQAGPREDVSFAVVGQFSTLVSFLKVRQVTTGRVFYQNGKLNIIFGIVHRDIKENEDRRLNPLTPGSRTHAAGLDDRIMALPGTQPFSKPREDWVVFDREGMNTPPPASAVPAAEQRREQPITRSVETATPRPTETKPAAPWGKARSTEERLIHLNELKNKNLITEEEYRAKRMDILNDL